MLDYVRDGDTLYVESISRLGRSTKDLLNIIDTLTDKGVTIINRKENIDTDTPTGKFMLTVFAALSQLEREQLKQRQRGGEWICRQILSIAVCVSMKPETASSSRLLLDEDKLPRPIVVSGQNQNIAEPIYSGEQKCPQSRPSLQNVNLPTKKEKVLRNACRAFPRACCAYRSCRHLQSCPHRCGII